MSDTATTTPAGKSAALGAAEKLNQLRRIFDEAPRGTAGMPSPHQVAEEFFHRAPSDYIERVGVEQMAKIATEGAKFFEQFLTGSEPFSVTVRNDLSGDDKRATTGVLSACYDRPFIVDTLIESLHAMGKRHRVLLHPIVRHHDGRRVSLIYVELERIAKEADREKIATRIRNRFADLMLMSDDFGQMLEHNQRAIALFSGSAPIKGFADEERAEFGAYLSWLADGGFVFLGTRSWKVVRGGAKPKLEHQLQSDLGLFRTADAEFRKELDEVQEDAQFLAESEHTTHFSKIFAESPVHRHARIDLLAFKAVDPNSGDEMVQLTIGLFTSKARSQEASSVPLIRRKLHSILEREGRLPNTHDYKEIISIVDSMPKSELVQNRIDVLRSDINLIINLQRRAEVRTRFHLDDLNRFYSVFVVMPRERYNTAVRRAIQQFVEKSFDTKEGSAEYGVMVTDYPLVVTHFLVPNIHRKEKKIDPARFERDIATLCMTWEDRFVDIAAPEHDDSGALERARHFGSQFPEQYKAATSPDEGVFDAKQLDNLSDQAPLQLAMAEVSDGVYDLKLFKQGEGLTLSGILPYLENAGLHIDSETVTTIPLQSGQSGTVYKLRVHPKSNNRLVKERIDSILLPGLVRVLRGEADNDRLNVLLSSPGLSYREIAVLRVLTHYLWQVKAGTSGQSLVSAVTENPAIAELLVEFFAVKFDPARFKSMDERQAALGALRERFQDALKQVTQLAHDRALRTMLNVIEAVVRTNFYRIGDDLRVALKIDCKRVESLPTPRPYFEIFVNAPDFQGVHLRGGKVARGGIRWSDRVDDFRTEVLGLMKTQMLKNSIIIPVGAKGGFVLKHRPTDPTELGEAVKGRYVRFVRSLLEVTDNLVSGKVVHPEKVVVYDGEDPYFVVAADRGTATFSDTANALATNEFNFWLGDAFASGGSNGYDHKKFAITARGAWETACRHFREIGIDVDQQEFTVVGIGDMSGDVFGNGLLQSKNARLLAAFDHRHVFLDPNPEAAASYAERLRMFNLPRSSWADYNRSLISAGGGVWDRNDKEITISPEVQNALGITEAKLSGQELVRSILKAPVDLLWNGGIGTYVKASTEDNLNVGDRANDEVRIDGRDLRVKVVAEGGNLGFTQLARIEYSKHGGHINTDAVDNSGGVNMSDLEVNLKILLRAAVERGALTLEKRNALLISLAEDVGERVVSRNRSQSMAISLGVRRSRKNLSYYRGLTNALEAEGLLDRKSEFLPDEETFERRTQLKAGLCRPELAILIGYAKMSLFNLLIDSKLPEDPFLERFLFNYFPEALQQQFPDDIRAHPLRREIIATEVANAVVDRMGSTFVFQTAEETGAKKLSIVRSFLAADAILGGRQLTQTLRIIDKPHATRLHHTTLIRLTSAIEGVVRWLLEHRNESESIQEAVARYGDQYRSLSEQADVLTSNVERTRYRDAVRQLIMGGVPKPLAVTAASSIYSSAFMDIIDLALSTGGPIVDVAKLYSQLSGMLHIRALFEQASEIETTDRWEAAAVRTLTADLRRSIAKLARAVIAEKGSATMDAMNGYLSERTEILERFKVTYQEFSNKQLTVPGLLALTNQLFALSRNAL